jgi:hypothetical protein
MSNRNNDLEEEEVSEEEDGEEKERHFCQRTAK